MLRVPHDNQFWDSSFVWTNHECDSITRIKNNFTKMTSVVIKHSIIWTFVSSFRKNTHFLRVLTLENTRSAWFRVLTQCTSSSSEDYYDDPNSSHELFIRIYSCGNYKSSNLLLYELQIPEYQNYTHKQKAIPHAQFFGSVGIKMHLWSFSIATPW